MKTKTIIGAVLTAALLVFGTVAYAHWNDYGDHDYYGTGYGYCGNGYVYGDGYNGRGNYPMVTTYTPCSGYWQGAGASYRHDDRQDVRPHAHDDRHTHHSGGWMGHRGYDSMGPRGCW